MMLFGTVLMHVLLQVNYPLDRAALHFFPLFGLAFFTAADLVPMRFSIPVSLVPALLFTIQQLSFLNLNRISHWDNEHVPREVLDYLHDWKDSTGKLPVVSVHGLPGRVLVYEVFQDERAPIYPIMDEFPASSADFILTYQWVENYPPGYEVRRQFPDVKMELLERKVPVNWVPLERKTPADIPFTHIGDRLAEFPMDGRNNESVLISFEGDLQFQKGPFGGWLALEILDTAHQELSKYHIDLGRTKIPLTGWRIHHKLLKKTL